jgi:hypothetical protein
MSLCENIVVYLYCWLYILALQQQKINKNVTKTAKTTQFCLKQRGMKIVSDKIIEILKGL